MKLLYCNEKIKFNLGQKNTEYEKIILCSDEDAPFLINAGYKEVSSMYDVEALKTISDEVNKNISSFNEKVSSLESLSSSLNETKTNLDDKLVTYDNKLNELNDLINSFNDKYSNIETIYNKVISFNTDFTLKVEEFNNKIISISKEKIDDADATISLLNNEINKTIQEYVETKDSFTKEIKTLIEQSENNVELSKEYAETSKKWACNPVNVPVENGLYSSLHYSSIQNNKQ